MLLSKIAHNEIAIRQAESTINALVDLAKRSGGRLWIQSKENKEHYYELTDFISISYFAPVEPVPKDEWCIMESRPNPTSNEDCLG